MIVGAGTVRGECLGEAEVENLHGAVGPDLDVGGLEVAMDDALFVGRFQGVGDLSRDRQRLRDRHAPARDDRGKVLPLDQFHHQRAHGTGFLEAVDVRDVRVIQRGECLCLAREAGEAIGIGSERLAAGP